MLKRHLTLIFKVDVFRRTFAVVRVDAPQSPNTATIANNVLMKMEIRAAEFTQCAVLGSFGSNTASSPIAGKYAQTW